MTAKSDIDHWQINAAVYHDRVEEIHYITDPAKNIRRRPHTKVWKTERFIGRGGFGEVRLERDTEDGKVRAVKKIPLLNTTLTNDECEKELQALLHFSKPKSREAAVFIDFFGWFKDDLNVFLAMEYIPLGDLETNVKAHSGRLAEIEARDITEQILSGLEIMHAESFAHRDLKPQNVLVVHGSPEWWVKLADFGLSKRLTEITAYRTRSGTQSYMAPELLDYLNTSSEEYTNAVDIWAVGCIIYRLVTGNVPFPPGRSLLEYCRDKSLFPYDALLDCGIKSTCAKFIKELLVVSPEQRPSASQALNHTWINSGAALPRQRLEGPHRTTEVNRPPSYSTSAGFYNTSTHGGLRSNSLQSSISEEQASIANGATLSLAQSDILTNSFFTEEVSSTLRPGPKSSSSSPANPLIKFSPDKMPPASKSQDKTVGTMVQRVLSAFKSPRKATLVHTLKGHNEAVVSVAFSPDGKVIASASSDKTIRLWDTTTGAVLQTLEGHTSRVWSVAFSPNGEVIASGSSDKTVKLWNNTTGAVLQTLEGHFGGVWSVAFSPTGKLIASGSADWTIRLWNTTTGAVLQTLNGHTSSVESVAFSPNGEVIASGSLDETVKLWNSTTGAVLQTLDEHTSGVWSVAFSPDGELIASGSLDETVKLWNTTTGAVLQTLNGHTSSVESVAFSPNGEVVTSGSPDKTVKLWNTTTGAILHTLIGHKHSVRSVAFSPDGELIASGSFDNTVKLWDIATIRVPHN